MNDTEAASRLYAHYAAGMDNRQFGLTREVFAADSRFTLSIKGTEAVPPIEGKQAIGDFIETTTREQTDVRRHVITNIRIGPETQDDATVTAILTLVVVENGVLEVKSSGLYRTRVVRTGEGWQFASMLLELDLAF